jgi:alpha-ketoglutarate-dependent dioxygenase alkB family protein 2
MKVLCSAVEGLNVHYMDKFVSTTDATNIFNYFENNLKYNSDESSKIFILGKYIKIPRKQVAYGEPGTYYNFSGTRVDAIDWNQNTELCKIIKNLKTRAETVLGEPINFVLINRYRDGNDYIGYHADDEKDLGGSPNITGVSFGAERMIYFKAKNSRRNNKNDKRRKKKLLLENGSMFTMYHPTNIYWKHSIPKSTYIKTPRISLTFRNMIKF